MGLGLKGGSGPSRSTGNGTSREEPGRRVDRRRQRGPAVQPQGRALRAPAQHELLSPKPLVMPASWRTAAAAAAGSAREATSVLVSCYSGRAHAAAGRYAALRLPPPAHAVQADRHARRSGPRASSTLHAGRRGRGDRREHGEHPPRDGRQPVDQLPVPRAREDEGVHRRGAREGLKVKIYYTVRELSNRAPELFALRSASGTRSSRRGPAAASRGCRNTSAATTSPPGSCPTSRTPRSSTAACRGGTTTTSRGSTGW